MSTVITFTGVAIRLTNSEFGSVLDFPIQETRILFDSGTGKVKFWYINLQHSFDIADTNYTMSGLQSAIAGWGADFNDPSGDLGYLNYTVQGSAPAAPASGVTMFAPANNQLAWKGVDTFTRTFAGAITADRIYTLPDASGTFGLLGSAQIWTATNTFSLRPGDNTGQIRVGVTGHAGAISFARSSNGNPTGFVGYRTGSSSDDFLVSNSAGSGTLAFATNSVDRLKITNTGNILINTNADDGVNQLQVTGSAKVGAATYSLSFGSPVISGYGGIWTGGVTPAVNNYAILANNSGNETLINAISGGKIGLRIANGEKVTINSTGIGIETIAPTHSLTFGSTSTGWAAYNNVGGLDNGLINYERVRGYWNTSSYEIITEQSGTGQPRALVFGGGGSYLSISNSGANGHYNFSRGSGISQSAIGLTGGISGSATGFANGISLMNTISQSGTAGYRAIWVSPYEQATGSGPKELLNLGTNSAANGSGTHNSKFIVNNLGNVQFGGANAAISGNLAGTFLVFGSDLELSGTSALQFKVNNTAYGKLFPTGRWFFGGSPSDDGVSTLNVNGAAKISGQLTATNSALSALFQTTGGGTNTINIQSTNASGYSTIGFLNNSGTQKGSFGHQNGAGSMLFFADGTDLVLSTFASTAAAFVTFKSANSSVLIGTATELPSSLLTLSSTTKGVRLPVMTTAQKNAISSPATGLIVFDSDLGKLCIFATTWQIITSA